MEGISMRGEYFVNDASEEDVYTRLLDFEKRYQRHQQRWTVYSKLDRKGNVLLQIRDHYHEIPRGLKPTMPYIKTKIFELDDGICIRYCCKWPIYYYFLFGVLFIFILIFYFVADSIYDGLYFLFSLFVFLIPVISFYTSDRKYKRDCVAVFDDLIKRNFNIIKGSELEE